MANHGIRPPVQTNRLIPSVFFGLVVLAIFSWQVAVFVFVGLLPTFVLSYTGSGPWKSEKIQCVGFCNAASLFPIVLPLWDRPGDFAATISNPLLIAAALSGAAIGYLLMFLGPIFAAVILQALSKERLSRVAKQRKELIEQWGGEIVGGSDDAAKS